MTERRVEHPLDGSLNSINWNDLIFQDSRGRERALQVLEREKIADGGMGDIHRVRVHLAHDDQNATDWTMTVKDYTKRGSRGRYFAEKATQIHEKLRRAGVRTWPTYRLEKEQPLVLMTDGESPLRELITPGHSTTSLSRERIKKWEPFEIANIEVAIAASIKDALAATNAGMFLEWDAWVISLDRSGGNAVRMECFVGDYESITTDITPGKPSSAPLQNLRGLYTALSSTFRILSNAGLLNSNEYHQYATKEIRRQIDLPNSS